MTASEKDNNNKEEIKTLLDAAWKPERVASYTLENVIKRIAPGSRNRLADKAAKQAAKGLGVTSEAPIKALILAELPELPLESPKYTEVQNQLAKAEGPSRLKRDGGNCQVANYWYQRSWNLLW